MGTGETLEVDEDRIQAKAREPLRGIWAATLTPFADERRRGRVATEPAPLERRGDDLVLHWQELLGQVGGPVRRPLLGLTESEKAATREAFEHCGLG